MKLIIRQYLSSLREREELDAILPDLLSELGFHVYSRPGRGTTQHGVDIAAVGRDDDGEEKLFLFSVKRGDLTRQNWDIGQQALRPSLNEVLDAYIPNRIPPAYAHLKVVICLCFGGDIQEQIRTSVTGFFKQNSTSRITFQEWNGDKIAGLLMVGVLREDVLPKPLRSAFQKAVALVDEPAVSFEHFSRLLEKLHAVATVDERTRIRSARQIYLCLWILFVWARDAENIESAYRSSERALLTTWNLLRPLLPDSKHSLDQVAEVFHELTKLHLIIASGFIEGRIFPNIDKRHAISVAVRSSSSLDVNLKLFDLLGKLALYGIWIHWIGENMGDHQKTQIKIQQICDAGLTLIKTNPTLYLPVTDYQATDIVCFFVLCLAGNSIDARLRDWLAQMVDRLIYAVKAHRRYPTIFTKYRDLLEHPRSATDEYRKEATAGSTLIPFLAAWLAKVGDSERLSRLVALTKNELAHCTFQSWVPDAEFEANLYVGSGEHGRALLDLPITIDGKQLSAILVSACDAEPAYDRLSANAFNQSPLVLLACKHWGLPVPPHAWIGALRLDESSEGTSGTA